MTTRSGGLLHHSAALNHPKTPVNGRQPTETIDVSAMGETFAREQGNPLREIVGIDAVATLKSEPIPE